MKKIRYFKLTNKGWFVAQMQVIWTGNDGKGNVSHGTYEPSGYHDICIHAERTIDLADKSTKIPDGAQVQLKVEVIAGKDKTATEKFIFSKDAGDTACYKISGTTLSNTLKLQ